MTNFNSFELLIIYASTQILVFNGHIFGQGQNQNCIGKKKY